MIRCYWVIRVADTLSAARGTPKPKGEQTFTIPIPFHSSTINQFIHYHTHTHTLPTKGNSLCSTLRTARANNKDHRRKTHTFFDPVLKSLSILTFDRRIDTLYSAPASSSNNPHPIFCDNPVRAIKPALYAGLNTNEKRQ